MRMPVKTNVPINSTYPFIYFLSYNFQVIKVVAEKRIGESNFISAIRETLLKHYGDKVVGKICTFKNIRQV